MATATIIDTANITDAVMATIITTETAVIKLQLCGSTSWSGRVHSFFVAYAVLSSSVEYSVEEEEC